MNINYEKNIDYMKLHLNYLDEYTFNNIKEFNTALKYMFLDMELQQYNNNYSVIYNIKNKITLKDYLRNSLTNVQASSLIEGLNKIRNCNFSNIKVGFVDLSEESIFIKENSEYLSVLFMYVPLNFNCSFIDNERLNRLVLEILLSVRDNDVRKQAINCYKNNSNNLAGIINILNQNNGTPMFQQTSNVQNNEKMNISRNETDNYVMQKNNYNQVNRYSNGNYPNDNYPNNNFKNNNIKNPPKIQQRKPRKEGLFAKIKKIFVDKNACYYTNINQNPNNLYYNSSLNKNNYGNNSNKSDDNYETMVLTSDVKLLVNNNNKISEYKLFFDTTVIGRMNNCDIKIESNIVSKQHATITKLNGNYFVTDKNSKNGTYINGRRLAPEENIKLNNGDIITLGNIACKFVE